MSTRRPFSSATVICNEVVCFSPKSQQKQAGAAEGAWLNVHLHRYLDVIGRWLHCFDLDVDVIRGACLRSLCHLGLFRSVSCYYGQTRRTRRYDATHQPLIVPVRHADFTVFPTLRVVCRGNLQDNGHHVNYWNCYTHTHWCRLESGTNMFILGPRGQTRQMYKRTNAVG